MRVWLHFCACAHSEGTSCKHASLRVFFKSCRNVSEGPCRPSGMTVALWQGETFYVNVYTERTSLSISLKESRADRRTRRDTDTSKYSGHPHPQRTPTVAAEYHLKKLLSWALRPLRLWNVGTPAVSPFWRPPDGPQDALEVRIKWVELADGIPLGSRFGAQVFLWLPRRVNSCGNRGLWILDVGNRTRTRRV